MKFLLLLGSLSLSCLAKAKVDQMSYCDLKAKSAVVLLVKNEGPLVDRIEALLTNETSKRQFHIGPFDWNSERENNREILAWSGAFESSGSYRVKLMKPGSSQPLGEYQFEVGKGRCHVKTQQVEYDLGKGTFNLRQVP